MYKIFVKNLEGFKKLFENDERLNMAKPLFLLNDIETFRQHKIQCTEEYRNLLAIIQKADELKQSDKYHSFGMFLNELHLQYFDFDESIQPDYQFNPETLEYQVSLLHQFMFPAYYS